MKPDGRGDSWSERRDIIRGPTCDCAPDPFRAANRLRLLASAIALALWALAIACAEPDEGLDTSGSDRTDRASESASDATSDRHDPHEAGGSRTSDGDADVGKRSEWIWIGVDRAGRVFAEAPWCAVPAPYELDAVPEQGASLGDLSAWLEGVARLASRSEESAIDDGGGAVAKPLVVIEASSENPWKHVELIRMVAISNAYLRVRLLVCAPGTRELSTREERDAEPASGAGFRRKLASAIDIGLKRPPRGLKWVTARLMMEPSVSESGEQAPVVEWQGRKMPLSKVGLGELASEVSALSADARPTGVKLEAGVGVSVRAAAQVLTTILDQGSRVSLAYVGVTEAELQLRPLPKGR